MKETAVDVRGALVAAGWLAEEINGRNGPVERWFGPAPRTHQPRFGLHVDIAWVFQKLSTEHDAPISWDELAAVYDSMGGPWNTACDRHKATGWAMGTRVHRTGSETPVGVVARWHGTRVAVAWNGDFHGPVEWFDSDTLTEAPT